jgi:sulfur-carrier protein adenylyltransferase/sulfurtransferase
MNSYEWQRFQRQIILDEVGIEGQERLLNARVVLIGAGGLGCPVATYLCAAGIGHLTIIDDDVVAISNLQRQILYTEQDIGLPKVVCMKRKLESQNLGIHIDALQTRLNSENALDLLQNHDVIIDGSDNLETRFVIDNASDRLNIPWIFGSVLRFDGQLATFRHQGSGGFSDLFSESDEATESCAEAGVLGVLPGIIGTMQATEAIKIILHQDDLMKDKILTINVLLWKIRQIMYQKKAL